MEIDSKLSFGKILPMFSDTEIKNEPMLFSSCYDHARGVSQFGGGGGDITKAFLDALPEELKNNKTIIDSRAHMLMPGWFPCVHGYHHDDVPRTWYDRVSDKLQPNYVNPSYRSKHVMALFHSHICPTEFAIGKADFSDPTSHDIVYKYWHNEVINNIKAGHLHKVIAPDHQLIFFDDRTWHQGTKAVKEGWRFFIRASWDTGRIATNEVRRQVQVYLENTMEGW